MNQLLLLLILVVAATLGTSIVRQLRAGQRAAAHHHRALDTLGHITSNRRQPHAQPEGEMVADAKPAGDEAALPPPSSEPSSEPSAHAHVRVVAADAPRRTTGPQVVLSASRFPRVLARQTPSPEPVGVGHADRRPTAELPAVHATAAPAGRSDPSPTPPGALPAAGPAPADSEGLVRIVDHLPPDVVGPATAAARPAPPRRGPAHRRRRLPASHRDLRLASRGGRPVVIAAGVVAALAVLGVAGMVAFSSGGSHPPKALPPVTTAAPSASSSTTIPPTSPPTTAPLSPSSTATGQATYQIGASASVTVTASAPAWVEIRNGGPRGAVSYMGVLSAGQSKTLSVPSWIRIGKPSATSISVSGQALSLPPSATAAPVNLTFS